jgi:hypothetical protein
MTLQRSQIVTTQGFTAYPLSDIGGKSYPIHPAAELFPMMSASELQELADDIKANGLLEPIILHDGQILDGRNRLQACVMAGVEPQYQNPAQPITSPVIYVVSKNLHRRHLTSSQRAAIGAEMMPLLQNEAKHRSLSNLKNQSPVSSAPIGAVGSVAEIAANAVGVGRNTVQRAATVLREDPATFEKIKSGEVSAWTAYEALPDTDRPAKVEAPKPLTERQAKVAANRKQRFEEGLSMIAGACEAINGLDIAAISAELTHAETDAWIEKAYGARNELTALIRALRGH